jgi:invasion protein IalB
VFGRVNRIVFAIVALALMMSAAGSARAQQSTTATYQDWLLQCNISASTPPRRVCTIGQTTQAQNQPFSRVLVAKPVKGRPISLLVQLPVNVLIAGNVRIQINEKDIGIAAPFDVCIPAGCIAKFELKDPLLQKFRGNAESTTGRIIFRDANGRAVAIPLSFKGFGQAYEALAKA